MTTTLELQQLIIDRCHAASACQDQFKQLLSVKDNTAHFLRVLLNNHSWCVDNKIYTSEFLQQFDPEILRRAGLLTQDTAPVDFNPVELGGLLWNGLNYGATKESLNGTHPKFDEAQKLPFDDGARVSSRFENTLLMTVPSLWGAYGNGFGRVFMAHGGNLYLPAAGYRYYYDGSLNNEATSGYYWSSSVNNSTYGYICHFYSGGVTPDNANSRGNGFSVRCVQELPSAKRV